MTHITMTGYDAGQPLCTLTRAAMVERGDTGIHMPYSRAGEATILARADVCPECKAVWNDAVSDEEA